MGDNGCMFWRRQQRVETVGATAPRNPWSATSVAAGQTCCRSASDLQDRRFLARETPALPLAACTQPELCRCVYRKHEDRRVGPRRSYESAGLLRPPPGHEDQRRLRGRRKTDY